MRFPGEDKLGPIDAWLRNTTIPPRPNPPFRVALIALWLGDMPEWIAYTARSLAFARNLGLLLDQINRPQHSMPAGRS